jgi:segregation and condensation protein B
MTKTDLKKKEIGEFIQKLALIYQARATALEIVRVGEDKFSLQIKPQYTEDVKKFASGGLLSEAVMRTLTIIAAKQPIPKAIVVKLRGGGAYQHIKELLQNELIVEQKKGRSSELMTTERFADMFGLSRDINELKKALIKSLGIKNE